MRKGTERESQRERGRQRKTEGESVCVCESERVRERFCSKGDRGRERECLRDKVMCGSIGRKEKPAVTYERRGEGSDK